MENTPNLTENLFHNKITINFWTRCNCVPDKAEFVPLYGNIRVNGVRDTDFSIDIKVPLKHWDSKAQMVRPSHILADELNKMILATKAKILNIKTNLENSNKPVTAAAIRQVFKLAKKQAFKQAKKQSEIKKFTFLTVAKDKLLMGPANKKTSWQMHKNRKVIIQNIAEFLGKANAKLMADDWDIALVNQFRAFMVAKKVGNRHIQRHIGTIKAVIDYAILHHWATRNQIATLKIEYSSNFDPEGLTENDINKLITCRQFNDREQKAVDAFLFMAATGMDYCDYSRREWGISYEDGRPWVEYSRKKVEHRPNQPNACPFMLEFGLSVVKKYGTIEDLPKMSLTELNRVIKVAAQKARLTFSKKLTSKRSRKTYANICANQLGISDEGLTYLLGHTSTKHLRSYRRISRTRVLMDLNQKRAS